MSSETQISTLVKLPNLDPRHHKLTSRLGFRNLKCFKLHHKNTLAVSHRILNFDPSPGARKGTVQLKKLGLIPAKEMAQVNVGRRFRAVRAPSPLCLMHPRSSRPILGMRVFQVAFTNFSGQGLRVEGSGLRDTTYMYIYIYVYTYDVCMYVCIYIYCVHHMPYVICHISYVIAHMSYEKS